MKHELRHHYYIRYADDFVFMSYDKDELIELLPKVELFLFSRLHLALHPNKVHLRTLASGVDFLGWVHFPDHQILRTATKKRMFRNIQAKDGQGEVMQAYLGLIGHGNSWKLRQNIQNCTAKFTSQHSSVRMFSL